jgi:1-deoxy-D-xylulose-5-phosphate reductoisomerase
MAVGGTATAVLNAANEVAVAEFLAGRIRFTRIPALVEQTLASIPRSDADTLEAVLAKDAEARDYAAAAAREMAA